MSYFSTSSVIKPWSTVYQYKAAKSLRGGANRRQSAIEVGLVLSPGNGSSLVTVLIIAHTVLPLLLRSSAIGMHRFCFYFMLSEVLSKALAPSCLDNPATRIKCKEILSFHKVLRLRHTMRTRFLFLYL